MSSENYNWSSTRNEKRKENWEVKNHIALAVIGPAEQQSPIQNQVKLLLRVLPDGFAVTWWGWCPCRILKRIQNEKTEHRTRRSKMLLYKSCRPRALTEQGWLQFQVKLILRVLPDGFAVIFVLVMLEKSPWKVKISTSHQQRCAWKIEN